MSHLVLRFFCSLLVCSGLTIAAEVCKDDLGPEGWHGRLAYAKNLTNGLSNEQDLLVEALVVSKTGPRTPTTPEVTHTVSFHFVGVDTKDVAYQFQLRFSFLPAAVVLGSMRQGDSLWYTYTELTAFEPYIADDKPVPFTLAFRTFGTRGLQVELKPVSGNEKTHFWWISNEGLGTADPDKLRRFEVWESNAHVKVKRTVLKATDSQQQQIP